MTGTIIAVMVLMAALLAGLVFAFLKASKGAVGKKAKSPGEPRIPSTQGQLPFEEIRDQVVKLKKGGYRMLVEIPGINLDLMEASERQNIMNRYKQILTSIDFPIQFYQQSRLVDISEYLNTLAKLRASAKSKFMKNQLDFYSKYLDDLIKKSSILTKRFYLVISYDEARERKNKKFTAGQNKKAGNGEKSEDKEFLNAEREFEKAKKQLYSRATAMENAFQSLGTKPHILTNQELLELFYTSYLKDRSVYQPIRGVKASDYTSLRVKGGTNDGI